MEGEDLGLANMSVNAGIKFRRDNLKKSTCENFPLK